MCVCVCGGGGGGGGIILHKICLISIEPRPNICNTVVHMLQRVVQGYSRDA